MQLLREKTGTWVMVHLRLTKHDSVFLQLVGLGKDRGFRYQQLLLEILIALPALR